MYRYSITLLCTIGLVACGKANTVEPSPSSEKLTLQLNRLQDGDLEYCDAATGECQTLPYDGNCNLVEIDIDPNSGDTCERCTMADGTVTDMGCDTNLVACVLVTLPEPDCIVCAYVDGAIVFSTCSVDEPQCTSDADCRDDTGNWGYCVDSQCVFEPDPCWNVICPLGHHCELEWVHCITEPCPPMPVCVPDEIRCNTDAECPDGFYCALTCPADGGTGEVPCNEGDPNCPPCYGVCEPRTPDTCKSDADCPFGYECVKTCPGGGTVPCDPNDLTCETDCVGHCEAVYYECLSDYDCVTPDKLMGVCRDGFCYYDTNTCYSDDDCPPGEICEIYDTMPPCDPETGTCFVAPGGVCVPAPMPCTTHDDCARSGIRAWCIEGRCEYEVDCDPNHAYCDMVPPACEPGEVPSVIGGCWGPCVPIEACMPIHPGCQDNSQCAPGEVCVVECWACGAQDPTCVGGCEGHCVPDHGGCRSDADCAAGEQCVTACWECIPEDPACVPGCGGWCEPSGQQCTSDADCIDADAQRGYCDNGWCHYDRVTCFADADCPEGQVCIFDGTWCGVPHNGGSGAPIWCGGYCGDAPQTPGTP